MLQNFKLNMPVQTIRELVNFSAHAIWGGGGGGEKQKKNYFCIFSPSVKKWFN